MGKTRKKFSRKATKNSKYEKNETENFPRKSLMIFLFNREYNMNSSAKNKSRTTNEIRLIKNFPFRHKQRIFITRNAEWRRKAVFMTKTTKILSIYIRHCMEAGVSFHSTCKGISGMSWCRKRKILKNGLAHIKCVKIFLFDCIKRAFCSVSLSLTSSSSSALYTRMLPRNAN